jgi:hypothetical protein
MTWCGLAARLISKKSTRFYPDFETLKRLRSHRASRKIHDLFTNSSFSTSKIFRSWKPIPKIVFQPVAERKVAGAKIPAATDRP